MPSDSLNRGIPTILLIAASRGLGLAMAAEFLKKGWNVVGTVRSGSDRKNLHALADQFNDRLEIETLDICEQAQVTTLRERLSGRSFEMLFVNAGVTNNQQETIGQVTTEDFIRVMLTNSLCPMRVVESLQDLVSSGTGAGVAGTVAASRCISSRNSGWLATVATVISDFLPERRSISASAFLNRASETFLVDTSRTSTLPRPTSTCWESRVPGFKVPDDPPRPMTFWTSTSAPTPTSH